MQSDLRNRKVQIVFASSFRTFLSCFLVTLTGLMVGTAIASTACKEQSLSSCQPKPGGWRTPLGTPCVPVHHTYDEESETTSRRLQGVQYSPRSAILLCEGSSCAWPSLNACMDFARNRFMTTTHENYNVICTDTSILKSCASLDIQYCDPKESFWNLCERNPNLQCTMTCMPSTPCQTSTYIVIEYEACTEGLSYDIVTKLCTSTPECAADRIRDKIRCICGR